MKHRTNRSSRTSQTKAPSSARIQTLKIESTTHEGNGVARENGKVIFVSGAISGETVEAKIIKEGRSFNQAVPLNWIEKSPNRISPDCPHFEQCGGCQLQHMSTAEQRSVKKEWIENEFRKLPLPDTMSQLVGNAFGYRRRARLSIFVKNQKTQLGFRAKASNDIVDIEQCRVLEPMLQSTYADLRSFLLETPLAAKLGHIELLQDDAGVCVILRQSRSMADEDKVPLNDWAKSKSIALYWQLPEQDKVACSIPRHYDVMGASVHFHPQDFIQVNREVNQLMVSQAIDWLNLSKEDVVLDLFCGAGNFSLPLAMNAGQVLAVEAIESMVEMGRFNAQTAGLDNLEFVAADLTLAPSNRIKKAKITKALLDPPRAGAYEFLPTLVRLKPKQILYVSCNASTLARDAGYLVEHGYRVTQVCMMDMFPQTSHVEAMMLLQY